MSVESVRRRNIPLHTTSVTWDTLIISTLGDRSINKTNNDDGSLTYNGMLLNGTLDASSQFFWLYFSFFLFFPFLQIQVLH